ncbi:MAG: helix-turn-helix domain-containing protein [Lapillicoccus sp.]
MRADAERNRQRILEAARQVFAEQGIEAPMSAVARRAGVGAATLSRRFPTREELVTAAFSDQLGWFAAVVDEAGRDPDPWHGFCRLVEQACGRQTGDLGFTDVLTRTFPRMLPFEARRTAVMDRFADLVSRAKASGRLRAEFVAEDLPLVLMAHAGVASVTSDAAPTAGPRLVAYLLQAFAAPQAGPLPTPPTPRQMSRALARMQVRSRRRPTPPVSSS